MGDQPKRDSQVQRGAGDGNGLRGPLDVCRQSELKDEWTWTSMDWARRFLLPRVLGGDKDRLRKYKDAWVKAHSSTIKTQAKLNDISPVLLAGVCWIEVGGDPDWIDTVAYPVRRFDHLADPFLEPLTITKRPELTSFGDVSIQLRRAAEAVGLIFTDLNSQEKRELIECLSDEDVNIAFVAKHLSQLKQVDKMCFTEEYEIRIIGARYNRGPELTLREIEEDMSYGNFILDRKQRFLDLLR